MIKALSLLGIIGFSLPVFGIQTKTLEYKHGEQVLEGFIAYPSKKKAPAVLIVHQWMGLTEHEKQSAKNLAKLGYVAFAIDVYGKGVRPKNVEEASRLANIYKNDSRLLRDRVRAAFDFVAKDSRVQNQSIAAIGYCFGGTAVLELARSGAPVAGVVSFHGGLKNLDPSDTQRITGKVLVLHGAADPMVPPAEVESFRKEMEATQVDWQMISYGHAVHAFTQKEAGNDPSKGAAYQKEAAERSWRAMEDFLQEVF